MSQTGSLDVQVGNLVDRVSQSQFVREMLLEILVVFGVVTLLHLPDLLAQLLALLAAFGSRGAP